MNTRKLGTLVFLMGIALISTGLIGLLVLSWVSNPLDGCLVTLGIGVLVLSGAEAFE